MTTGVVRLGIEGLPFFPIWCQRVAAALAMANSGLGLVETALQDEPGDCLGSFLFPGTIPWGEGTIQPCPDILESCALSQKLQAILILARSGLLKAKVKALRCMRWDYMWLFFQIFFFYTNGILHMYYIYILLKIRKKKKPKEEKKATSINILGCIFGLFSMQISLFIFL